MPRYEVYTLDMWGHVGADCIGHGCPCVTQRDTEEDSLGESAAVDAREATATHDENACDCSENCNQQFRHGTFTVPKDTSDAAFLAALAEDQGFTFPEGATLDDYSDGPLDVNDADGRRLLHLIPIEPMHFRVPLVWRRTARYHERLRPHVGQDGSLDWCGDGGYPLYYVLSTKGYRGGDPSAEIACPKCATDCHEHGDDDTTVTHVDVNWEHPDLYCDCGERIPSAYAECGDCDNGPKTTPGLYYEACSDPECTDDHLGTCVTCRGKGSPLGPDEREAGGMPTMDGTQRKPPTQESEA